MTATLAQQTMLTRTTLELIIHMHILLISRHYPPEVSGGARRPFLLTQSLRKQGVRVTVVTPFLNKNEPDLICVPHPVHGDQPPHTDSSTSTPTPMRDLLRQWLLWPDPEIRWHKKVAKHLIKANLKPDWLMTTSPPESAHLIGAKLATDLKVSWLAEFRDTWITVPHREILATSPIRAFLERRIAHHCLKHVNALTGVSEPVLREARNYAAKDTPEIEIGHFSTPPPTSLVLPSDCLNLIHTGGFTLSDRRRLIIPLFDTISRAAIANAKAGKMPLHLHLAGRLTTEEQTIAKSISTFHITLYGEVALDKAQALQAAADALILYTPPKSHALPGKYAEYLFARRPILFLGGGEWLTLVADSTRITPLERGLPILKKGTTIEGTQTFSADDAATQLISFLASS